ncbi:MAG: serine hydrolase [Balneolaceae bacterium]|nr:MAG: serine hydrolase [Balneolaceae bacterium]
MINTLRNLLLLVVLIAGCAGQENKNHWQAADAFLDEAAGNALFSVAVHDADGAELYARNAGRQVASASVIKIPILAELMRMVDGNELSLDETYTMTSGDIVGGSGELQHAGPGGEYTLEYLAREMIRVSDNTATNIIIRRIGMERINRLMAELDMDQTVLARYMMDFQAIEEGRQNYTSAADMNRVLLAIMGHHLQGSDLMSRDWITEDSSNVSPVSTEFLSASSRELVLDMLTGCADKTLIPRYLPDSIHVAHKTGTLTYVRGDSGIIFGEKPVIVTIFAEDFGDLETAEEQIGEIARLIHEISRVE